jgi:tRNA A37 threonylcarbamoyladenosine synthetase subunit TsaC/SUA5/YrdC
VPASTIPLAVIKAAGVPITATSANLAGAAECTTAQAVKDQLKDRIPIIVDGGTSPRSVPSTIVDLSGDGDPMRIIREGAIAVQEINQLLGK